MSLSNEASEIFGAMWGLTLLGALRSAGAHFPFDDEWRAYAARQAPELDAASRTLQRVLGFSPAVADMLTNDAPWTSSATPYLTDREAVYGELALMLKADRDGLAAVQARDLHEVIDAATTSQLSELLDGVLMAAYSAGRHLKVEDALTLLGHAVRLAGKDEVVLRATLSIVFDAWSANYMSKLEETAANAELVRWLVALRNEWFPDSTP